MCLICIYHVCLWCNPAIYSTAVAEEQASGTQWVGWPGRRAWTAVALLDARLRQDGLLRGFPSSKAGSLQPLSATSQFVTFLL